MEIFRSGDFEGHCVALVNCVESLIFYRNCSFVLSPTTSMNVGQTEFSLMIPCCTKLCSETNINKTQYIGFLENYGF